eukprot:CAMPEP_0172001736 /NCGR_PEP_ID=MMETSP1041-20130122/3031_1 /TAXON_ID=464988 /ORGANISM="Hemiselmis andersenii, Strain CCMP439" /LENGTH=84 /DNA_ID=CAMNT_0012655401 /DNA_START=132 /DNA_END=386 /DNA_ORIENTATION=-
MARPRKKKRLTCAQNLAKGHAEIAREKGLGGHGGEQASAPQEEIQSSASNVSTVPPDATTEGAFQPLCESEEDIAPSLTASGTD